MVKVMVLGRTEALAIGTLEAKFVEIFVKMHLGNVSKMAAILYRDSVDGI